MANSDSYRKLQDAWVSGNSGSTWEEVALVFCQLPVFLFFACVLGNHSSFMQNFILVILPIILTITDVFLITNVFFKLKAFAVLIALYYVYRGSFSVRLFKDEIRRSPTTVWVTNFRATVYIVTAITILAVDFTIYPRRFMKTETYGFSVMDVGVGAFIFCNAIRSEVPVSKTFKSAATLLILGVLRILSTRSVHYQHHFTEYGVHWNFFFTLCACQIITGLLGHTYKKSFWLAVTTLYIHQLTLNNGLEKWVLSSSPRDDFVSANREGLVSILGYVALFYTAATVFSFIRKAQSRGALITRLTICCLFFMYLFQVSILIHNVSRRLCNISYILWIITLGSLILLLLVLVELLLVSCSLKYPIPHIMAAVNNNGLFFFLMANLLTGLITMNVQTLLLSSIDSYIILTFYALVICYVMHWLYIRDIKVKLFL